MTLVDISSLFKDMYPRAGERIKQWVVDMRREAKWEDETCPRFFVHRHLDNTGAPCRNSGEQTVWTHLEHDCCGICCDLKEHFRMTDAVIGWLMERGKRPPVEQDRTKLSDEIEPDRALEPNPLFAMLRRAP